jgi:tetratricopeptide (TPR) repeat protein
MVTLRLQFAAALLAVAAFLPLLGLPAPPLADTPPALPWMSRPGAAALLWCADAAGASAAAQAAAAILLHAVNSALLAALLPALFTSRAAALAALIYAVHPLQADTLAMPSLAALLPAITLALCAALAFLNNHARAGMALSILALLFEPAAGAIPPLLLLLAGRNAGGRALYWLTAAGAAAWLAALRTSWPQLAAEWPWFGVFALRAVFLTLFPLALTPAPDLRAAPHQAAAAVAAVVIVAWMAWTAGKRHALGAWFLAGIVLLASVYCLPAGAGGRSLALPLTALAAFTALLLEQADWRLSAVYIAALVLLSFSYARLWRDPAAIGMEAVRLAPRLAAPALALAPHLPPAQALELLAETRRQAQPSADLTVAYGRALVRAQRPHEALAEFDQALDLAPRSYAALAGRASAWLALGQPEAARADLLRALAIEPCSLEVRLALTRLGAAPTAEEPRCAWNRAQRRALAAISNRESPPAPARTANPAIHTP